MVLQVEACKNHITRRPATRPMCPWAKAADALRAGHELTGHALLLPDLPAQRDDTGLILGLAAAFLLPAAVGLAVAYFTGELQGCVRLLWGQGLPASA
jgi:hypothetical protein